MNIGECFGEWQSVIGIPSRLTVHGSPPTSHETLESPDGDYLLPGFRPRTTASFLGLSKGAQKQNNARITTRGLRITVHEHSDPV